MSKAQPLSPKQIEFIANANAHWNMAHGPVSSGKTIGTLVKFMNRVHFCPDSHIWMVGNTSSTIFNNAIKLLLESENPALSMYRPYLTWMKGERKLKFRDKTINTAGAGDEGAIGTFQGLTMSLCYCDEITLYPPNVIDMIDTRLRLPHSQGYASMNPSYPTHKVKGWIDKAAAGDKNYYALQFMLEDNPYLPDDYKLRIKNSLSGMFYKRNYLGIWCLAEGAIFDFFDRDIYVLAKPPRAAEYWIAAIDYGSIHPFVCLLIGVSTGRYTQSGKCMWVEKEYFWDSKRQGRQKTQSEFADDVHEFLEPYGIKNIYIDPSAESFHNELRRRGMHVVHANNDVFNGIQYTASEMRKGNLFICQECINTIRQIEGYVWDSNAAKKGEDKPLKVEDDAVDALRYAIYTHKVAPWNGDTHNPGDFLRDKYRVTR